MQQIIIWIHYHHHNYHLDRYDVGDDDDDAEEDGWWWWWCVLAEVLFWWWRVAGNRWVVRYWERERRSSMARPHLCQWGRGGNCYEWLHLLAVNKESNRKLVESDCTCVSNVQSGQQIMKVSSGKFSYLRFTYIYGILLPTSDIHEESIWSVMG